MGTEGGRHPQVGDLAVPLLGETDFAQIAQHARMDQLFARRRREGVGGRGLARLRQARRERGFVLVQRAGEAVGDVVGQRRARQDEAPGTDRGDGLVLPGIAAGGHAHRAQEAVFGQDAPRLIGIGRDKARAARRLGYRAKTRPAEPGAP